MNEHTDYPSHCPRCKARTQRGDIYPNYVLCRNIGCPWFLTLDDGVEHFRG